MTYKQPTQSETQLEETLDGTKTQKTDDLKVHQKTDDLKVHKSSRPGTAGARNIAELHDERQR